MSPSDSNAIWVVVPLRHRMTKNQKKQFRIKTNRIIDQLAANSEFNYHMNRK